LTKQQARQAGCGIEPHDPVLSDRLAAGGLSACRLAGGPAAGGGLTTEWAAGRRWTIRNTRHRQTLTSRGRHHDAGE
jgi:hypothetical protein